MRSLPVEYDLRLGGERRSGADRRSGRDRRAERRRTSQPNYSRHNPWPLA